MAREGVPTKKSAHLGGYYLCSGPDPSGPAPGPRIIFVIYDENDKVVRRFEEIQGSCIDEGYVDFFLGPNCRPAKHLYHFIDIDPLTLEDGKPTATILDTHGANAGVPWLRANLTGWFQEHGKPEYGKAA